MNSLLYFAKKVTETVSFMKEKTLIKAGTTWEIVEPGPGHLDSGVSLKNIETGKRIYIHTQREFAAILLDESHEIYVIEKQ